MERTKNGWSIFYNNCILTPDSATCVEAVKAAIVADYTHIDTAAIYKNEKSVGEGIKENLDVFDFELSQQEMFEIESLKADRIGSDPDTCDF